VDHTVFKHLLIVVECREGAWSAVVQGLALALRHEATVTLALAVPHSAAVMVDMPGMPVLGGDASSLEVARYGQQAMLRAKHEADRLGVQSRTECIDFAGLPSALAVRARAVGADVIVMACEPVNAVVRLVTGSLVPGVLTASSVPVLVCPDLELR
jgi:nucleotide-binding universal stress UspA family protein